MIIEKIKEGEEIITNKLDDFCDFTYWGDYYLLTYWETRCEAAITLDRNTNLEDLAEKYKGSLLYAKFCGTTFHPYKSDNRRRNWSENLDEVISWTKFADGFKIKPKQYYPPNEYHSSYYEYLRNYSSKYELEVGIGWLSRQDRVASWANLDAPMDWHLSILLKVLVTGRGFEEYDVAPCTVRYPDGKRRRGTNWYTLT